MEEKFSGMSVSMCVWSLCINVSVLREHQRIPTVIKLLKLFSLKIEVSVQWSSADLLFPTPKLLVYLASHLTNDTEAKPTAGVLSKEIHTECTHHPWPKYLLQPHGSNILNMPLAKRKTTACAVLERVKRSILTNLCLQKLSWLRMHLSFYEKTQHGTFDHCQYLPSVFSIFLSINNKFTNTSFQDIYWSMSKFLKGHRQTLVL